MLSFPSFFSWLKTLPQPNKKSHRNSRSSKFISHHKTLLYLSFFSFTTLSSVSNDDDCVYCEFFCEFFLSHFFNEQE